MTAAEKRKRAAARKRAGVYRARYWAAREAGLCVQTHCRKNAVKGRTRCRACEEWLRERARESQRRARKAADAAGVPRPY